MTRHEIRTRRRALGFTQAQLAEVLGYTPGCVGNWEQGRSVPSRAVVMAMLWLEWRHRIEGAAMFRRRLGVAA